MHKEVSAKQDATVDAASDQSGQPGQPSVAARYLPLAGLATFSWAIVSVYGVTVGLFTASAAAFSWPVVCAAVFAPVLVLTHIGRLFPPGDVAAKVGYRMALPRELLAAVLVCLPSGMLVCVAFFIWSRLDVFLLWGCSICLAPVALGLGYVRIRCIRLTRRARRLLGSGLLVRATVIRSALKARSQVIQYNYSVGEKSLTRRLHISQFHPVALVTIGDKLDLLVDAVHPQHALPRALLCAPPCAADELKWEYLIPLQRFNYYSGLHAWHRLQEDALSLLDQPDADRIGAHAEAVREELSGLLLGIVSSCELYGRHIEWLESRGRLHLIARFPNDVKTLLFFIGHIMATVLSRVPTATAMGLLKIPAQEHGRVLAVVEQYRNAPGEQSVFGPYAGATGDYLGATPWKRRPVAAVRRLWCRPELRWLRLWSAYFSSQCDVLMGAVVTYQILSDAILSVSSPLTAEQRDLLYEQAYAPMQLLDGLGLWQLRDPAWFRARDPELREKLGVPPEEHVSFLEEDSSESQLRLADRLSWIRDIEAASEDVLCSLVIDLAHFAQQEGAMAAAELWRHAGCRFVRHGLVLADMGIEPEQIGEVLRSSIPVDLPDHVRRKYGILVTGLLCILAGDAPDRVESALREV